MITVTFLVRTDFFEKFGGDTYQVSQYMSNFNPEKINSSIVTLDDLTEIPNSDIFILVNLDLVYEFTVFFVRFKTAKLLSKLFLLPIHHSAKCMNAMLRIRFRCLRYFFDLFGGYLFFERLKSFYFAFSRRKFKHLWLLLVHPPRAELREALASCPIIYIADGELKSLEMDFDVFSFKCFYKVRNGVATSFVEGLDKISFRPIDVLVVGRIEQRKNQVEIAKLLMNCGLSVLFVGATNANNKSYVDNFFKLISSSDNLKYQSHVPSEEMASLYCSAKVALSASFFEVSSLADLEAYYAGCYVIYSKNGNSSEYVVGRGTEEIDPYDMKELLEKINNAISHFQINKHDFHGRRPYLWSEAAATLESHLLKHVGFGQEIESFQDIAL